MCFLGVLNRITMIALRRVLCRAAHSGKRTHQRNPENLENLAYPFGDGAGELLVAGGAAGRPAPAWSGDPARQPLRAHRR
jgi:hypothetical protein